MSSNDWEKCQKIELEIDKLKGSQFEFWTVPESAFITFECDDAKELAEDASTRNEKEEVYKILGSTYKLKNFCPEPTDIIWENRHMTPTN